MANKINHHHCINNFDEYASTTERLQFLLFNEHSPIKTDMDFFKDYTTGLSLLGEVEKAKLILKLNFLKGNLQKEMFIIFSKSASMKEKRAAEALYKSLINNTQNGIRHLEIGNVAKGLVFIGAITATYDLFDAAVKSRQGDVWGAIYSTEIGVTGIVGVAAVWFPPVAPIAIAAAVTDLLVKYTITPWLFKPGDDFQNMVDDAIIKIADISLAVIKESNHILKDCSFTISMKVEKINSIIQQRQQFVNNIDIAVRKSFNTVPLKYFVEGSYTAFCDTVANDNKFIIILLGKLQKLNHLKSQYVVQSHRASKTQWHC